MLSEASLYILIRSLPGLGVYEPYFLPTASASHRTQPAWGQEKRQALCSEHDASWLDLEQAHTGGPEKLDCDAQWEAG